MINAWSSPDEQDKWEIMDQVLCQSSDGRTRVSPQSLLARIIGGTGKILSQTRQKLASWYSDNGEQSYAPHIDL